MAQFTVDPSNPDMVIGPGGTVMPRYAIDPADIAPAAPAVPATAAEVLAKLDAVVPPTGQTPAVRGVLSKLDAVTGPLVQTGASHSRSVQRGVPAAQLQPVLDANTASTEAMASKVEQQGAAKTERATQSAETDLYQAQGQHATAEAAREDAAQRAKIASMNQLAIASQTDPEVDPDRVVREMSTGKQIGMVILAMLQGAFNSTNNQPGQPNQVIGIIQKRIEQDIAAQREAIASGRIRRGNMVSYFREQGMNEEAAAKAAEARSWAMVERMTQAQKALVAAPEAQEQADLVAQQMRAQVEAKNAELTLSLGTDRVSEQSNTTFERAAAPAGPDVAKALQTDKLLEEQGYSREQRAKALAAMGLPAPDGQTAAELKRDQEGKGPKYSEVEGKAVAARDTTEAFYLKAGLVRNPKTGQWEVSDQGIVPPGFVESINPFDDNEIQALGDAAVEGFGRLESGGVIGFEDELPQFREQVGLKTGNRKQLAARANAIDRIIQGKLPADQRGKAVNAPADWK